MKTVLLEHCVSLTKEFSGIQDQRRSKLKSMETEEDLDSVMANLINSAANLNIQRFHCAIEIKVEIFVQ